MRFSWIKMHQCNAQPAAESSIISFFSHAHLKPVHHVSSCTAFLSDGPYCSTGERRDVVCVCDLPCPHCFRKVALGNWDDRALLLFPINNFIKRSIVEFDARRAAIRQRKGMADFSVAFLVKRACLEGEVCACRTLIDECEQPRARDAAIRRLPNHKLRVLEANRVRTARLRTRHFDASDHKATVLKRHVKANRSNWASADHALNLGDAESRHERVDDVEVLCDRRAPIAKVIHLKPTCQRIEATSAQFRVHLFDEALIVADDVADPRQPV